MLQEFLFGDFGVDFGWNNVNNNNNNTNTLAVNWLAQEASQLAAPPRNQQVEFNQKLVQRFALLAMDFALQDAKFLQDDPLNARFGVDECEWDGIVCDGNGNNNDDDGIVTEVRWEYQEGLPVNGGGRIAPEVRLLADSLTRLDLSNNQLVGTIPEELYSLTNLKKLYLFRNSLEGTISKKIGDLDSITHFHLSHNNLEGTIPQELKSDGSGIRPLGKCWTILYYTRIYMLCCAARCGAVLLQFVSVECLRHDNIDIL